jgi:hypothetical protein
VVPVASMLAREKLCWLEALGSDQPALLEVNGTSKMEMPV